VAFWGFFKYKTDFLEQFHPSGWHIWCLFPKPQLSQHAGHVCWWMRGPVARCLCPCDCQVADSGTLCSKIPTFWDSFPAGHSIWSLIKKPQLSQHADTQGRPRVCLASACDSPCDCQLADTKCVVRFLSIKLAKSGPITQLDTLVGQILQNPSSLSTPVPCAFGKCNQDQSQPLPLTHR